MNTKNLFALDFTKSSIVASATTLRKARNPESPECKALMRMLSEHPSDCGAGNGRNASSRKNAHFSVAHSRWTLMQGGQENA